MIRLVSFLVAGSMGWLVVSMCNVAANAERDAEHQAKRLERLLR